jgi:hypothetical protein
VSKKTPAVATAPGLERDVVLRLIAKFKTLSRLNAEAAQSAKAAEERAVREGRAHGYRTCHRILLTRLSHLGLSREAVLEAIQRLNTLRGVNMHETMTGVPGLRTANHSGRAGAYETCADILIQSLPE